MSTLSSQDSTDPTNNATLNFPTQPSKSYNTGVIDDFLRLVFKDYKIPKAEEIMTWQVSPGYNPAYPVDETSLMDSLEKTDTPKALYFGTSTCRRDPKKNRTFNRKSLFEGFYVLVLDDIGTKVPVSKLPPEMEPTYIIETSADNFQYGYVLEEPIRKLAEAEALIQIMYGSGFSDEGGKMATKIVRLPEGINGKKGPKQNFVSVLHTTKGPKWTPAGLLKAAQLSIDWADVEKDAEDVMKRTQGRSVGTSLWSPTPSTAGNTAGVVDPVLEWFYEQEQVVQDTNDWVTILCPFANNHSTGGDTASYMPVGRGDMPQHRGFKCFHESCATQKTPELLQFVSANGGPYAGVFDPVADITAEWVYDAADDIVWRIRGTDRPEYITTTAFKMNFPQSVAVFSESGQKKLVKEHALWTTAPNRVTVFGRTFDPSTTARITEEGKNLRINTFLPPSWGEVKPAESTHHLKMFNEFIEYLIPNDEERRYFLDWLACKAQDMSFRGAAMVMIAKAQGTGRTTLGDMIATLFTRANVENVPFSTIASESGFNDWMENPIIITDETLSSSAAEHYRVYEKLKDIIDPRPKMVRINPKYGKQRVSKVCSSYMFFSNHSNALAAAENDRRLYVITNPDIPAKPSFYTSLNDWLEEKTPEDAPLWAAHIWAWLRDRKVDVESMLAPPKLTRGKHQMLSENRSPLDTLLKALFDALPKEYVHFQLVEECATLFAHRIGYYNMNNPEAVLKRRFKELTATLHPQLVVIVNGKSTRPKAVLARINAGTISRDGLAPSSTQKGEIKDCCLVLEKTKKELFAKVGCSLELLDL